MQHKNYFTSLLLLLFATMATAQTCPGPVNRTALINLQKSNVVNGTRWGQMVLTDTCGNQRYVTLDSVIVVIVDSIQADTTLQRNWYTHNGVTTDLGRTAFVKRSAWWRGLDTLGFMRFTMRPTLFTGTQFTVYNDSTVWDYINASGVRNLVSIADTGIILATAEDLARSINFWTDTVNWSSSFDPALQIHNLRADGTYFYADSLKVVALGQFSAFPSLDYDGTEKGFYYEPDDDGMFIINGNGTTGRHSYINVRDGQISSYVQDDVSAADYSSILNDANATEVNIEGTLESDGSFLGTSFFDFASGDNTSIFGFSHAEKDTNERISLYFGTTTAVSNNAYTGPPAFGLRIGHTTLDYDVFEIRLLNDTTQNMISFYDSSYLWANARPLENIGDISFHFWAGNGIDTDPGFMTLDDIRAGGVNIYNSDGQQTDNTRIDTIRQTIEFTRLNTGSSFEPGFKVSARAGTRPSAQGWYFNNNADSILMYKTGGDIAFLESATMPFGFTAVAGNYIFFDGDSIQINFGALPISDEGDILVVTGVDASNRTVHSLEGTFNADVLSWAAGSAGDKWEAVPANRTSIATTSASLIPSESTAEILVDGTGGGTVELNYTPAMPGTGYTTYRYIYNATAGVTTVDTDQAWEFRDSTGDLGSSFNLAAGENCKLIWIYDATPANARFFVIKF